MMGDQRDLPQQVLVDSRLGFWLPFVLLGLLGLAGIFAAAVLRDPDEDLTLFVIVETAVLLMAGLSYGWYRQARVTIDANGTLIVRQPLSSKTLDLNNLVQLTMRPHRHPDQMKGPGYRFRLVDASGNRLKLSQMFWQQEGRIFALVSASAARKSGVLDEITQAALDALAQSEAEAEPVSTPSAAWKGAAVLLLLVFGVGLAGGLAERTLNELFPGSRDRCDQVEQITENLARDPGSVQPGAVDLGTQWRAISPVLLQHPGPEYRLIDQGPFDFNLPGKGNAEKLKVLNEHGYFGAVTRHWTTPMGTRLEHNVSAFPTQRAAEAYEVEIVTNACQFAN